MLTNLDSGLGEGFLTECSEQLAILEADLLALENGGTEVDPERAYGALRRAHSIKGGAYFLDLEKVGDLAQRTEETLALIHARKMAPTPENIDVLLRATDRLHELIQSPATSNQADIGQLMETLAGLPDRRLSPGKGSSATSGTDPGSRRLRVLVVEDDFTSRLMLQTFLSRYGECHIAVNGKEAVEACRVAVETRQNYDLICMDIMMPEMDGHEAVRQVRALEESHGIFSSRGSKITMTTTVGDIKKVFECFKVLCDGYLVKPIDLTKLVGYMKTWGLIKPVARLSGAGILPV
jgi:two-component system chemotaxis response regulator CheY